MNKSRNKCSPLLYAILGIPAVPFAAVVMAMAVVVLVVAWPIAPFIFYFERKRELQKEKN